VTEPDPLSEMRSQVDAAYAAADRLVREADAAARERAGESREIPPSGYEGERTSSERSAFSDLQALAGLLEAARTSVPPEVARQLADAARELLLALRALIDWWIARLEREPERPVEVQDIPIE
jgi:hypothetical protein